LTDALKSSAVGWYEDASNLDTTLLRNRIRHQFFPAARKHGVDPVDLFCRWQRQAAHLSVRLNMLADDVALDMQQGMAVVDWEAWSSSPQAVRALLLQRMSASLFGEGTVLGRRHILLAEEWRRKGGRQGIDLSRCRLFRSRETLHLAAASVSLPVMPH
jgi:tRNA(Ile)-lysidine synthase